MENVIAQLCQDRVFYHFYQISQIPHGSGNEKGISDYFCAWAKELGLEAEQDELNNVLIRKAATAGYENAPAVMMQAHMDMVCEKADGVEHDFTKDPITWVVEDDMLSTGGRTTLGADNGIGVALAMAVLESKELAHPELEVLFTVNEEEDLSGADGFDTRKMKATRLFNLDHAEETQVLCGSCGGMQVDFTVPVETAAVPEGYTAFRLSVSGLKGGHSGEDIHRGRGNANVLLTRALMAIEAVCPFYINSIKGGSFRLAIPRDSECVISLPADRLAEVKEILAALEQDFRAEMSVTAESICVMLEEKEGTQTAAVPEKVLTALTSFPDGIYQMNEMLTGLVDTSNNMGEVYLNGEQLHIVTEVRSARESLRTYLFQRMERLAKLMGGTCTFCNSYPSWDFRPDSALREIYGKTFEAIEGRQPDYLTVHAGLEVGCFFATKPEIDAISIGPNCWNFQSPSECVSISSTKKVYRYLCNTLAELR